MAFKSSSYPGLPGIGPTKSKKVKTHRATRLLIFSILVLLLYLRVSCLHTGPHLFDRHALPDLYEVSIEELQDGLEKGLFTSVDLVKAYFARIDEVNLKGPALHAVLETNPMALKQAAALDEERRTKGLRGPLHGIPIMLKDNIATVASEGMNTTAGSFALVGSIPPRDATVVAKLRKAGAILLGKSNLSEWSHARGTLATGWSGRGGQTTCAYYPGGDASGSSSGSGVSSSIGLAAAALGTETNGSIVFPCSKNNLVGIKPTVGLTSRAGVIPISAHQDTVGPMARSLADAVTVLTAIIGPDRLDNYTLAQPMPLPDYSSALVRGGLKGARLGVPRRLFPEDENMAAAFNATLSAMEDLGAIVVDSAELPSTDEQIASQNQSLKLNVDLKFDLAKYMDELLEVPTGVKNLTDLIAYNLAHSDQELPAPWYTSQEIFLKAENVTQDEAYYAAIAADYDLGRTRGIDGVMKMYDLDALILPSEGWGSPAAAIAGYPIVAIPLGFQSDDVSPTPAEPIVKRAPGMPFGMVFVGTAFDEYRLIHLAYDYEQATQTRLKQRAFPAAIPKTQLVDVIRRRGHTSKRLI